MIMTRHGKAEPQLRREGDVMGQTAHHYLIFETAGGFCGIAWNNVGITRFQLPTKSAEGAERTLLRRLPGAERGAPTPEVVEAVAAVMMRTIPLLAGTLALVTGVLTVEVNAAEVKVLSAGAMRGILQELAPAFRNRLRA
jgi:hypothetical protein